MLTVFVDNESRPFELTNLLIKKNTTTKVKIKRPQDNNNKNMQFLIFYKSSIPIHPIYNDILEIVSQKDDKRRYKQLTSDPEYSTLGTTRIETLEIEEINNINRLLVIGCEIS